MTHNASTSRCSRSLFAVRCSLSSLCLCAFVPLLTGCVERRISITSEPTGALVWVNDVEVGRTPTEANFKHYGKYDVRLELDGYDTLQTVGDASTPWWDFPGPDLIAEAVPGAKSTIKWHFELSPALASTMPKDQFESGMIDRAHALRDQLGPAPAPQPDSVGIPASDGKADDSLKPADLPRDDSAGPDR